MLCHIYMSLNLNSKLLKMCHICFGVIKRLNYLDM